MTPPPKEAARLGDRLTVLDVAGIFAAAIRACHSGGSIVDLLSMRQRAGPDRLASPKASIRAHPAKRDINSQVGTVSGKRSGSLQPLRAAS